MNWFNILENKSHNGTIITRDYGVVKLEMIEWQLGAFQEEKV